MDELRTESNIIESIPSNLEQDAIFSSEINKRNKNKSKKSIVIKILFFTNLIIFKI